MKFFKKNIILTPADYSNVVINNAVLSLEQFSKEEAIGTLKCNNLSNIKSKAILGILLNNDLKKFEIPTQINEDYCFSLPINFENCEKISCVMLTENNLNYTPVLWGSTETSKAFQSNIMSAINNNSINTNSIYESEILSNEDVETEDDEEDIENLIDKEMEKHCECEHCTYKNNFYGQTLKTTNSIQNEDKNIFEKGEGDNFFALIEGQVDELLNKYPLEDAITQIIPNSKFVRVDYNNDGNYYIFGVIYEENADKPKYICYGIPAMFGDEAPQQIDGFYQWLPVDANKPEGEGYYIMYQNAETGENIKVEVV